MKIFACRPTCFYLIFMLPSTFSVVIEVPGRRLDARAGELPGVRPRPIEFTFVCLPAAQVRREVAAGELPSGRGGGGRGRCGGGRYVRLWRPERAALTGGHRLGYDQEIIEGDEARVTATTQGHNPYLYRMYS
jgi:hypothetical protein